MQFLKEMGAETKEMGAETKDCTLGPPYFPIFGRDFFLRFSVFNRRMINSCYCYFTKIFSK